MTKVLLSLFFFLSVCSYAHANTNEIIPLDYFPDSELYNARELPASEGKINSKDERKYFLQSIYSFGEMFNTPNKYEELYEKSLLSDLALISNKNDIYHAAQLPDCSTSIKQVACPFIKSYFDEINTINNLYKNGKTLNDIKKHIHNNANINKANFLTLINHYRSKNEHDYSIKDKNYSNNMTFQEKEEIKEYCNKDVYFRSLLNDENKFAYLHYKKLNTTLSKEKVNELLYQNNLAIFMVKLKSDYYNQSMGKVSNFDHSLSFILNIYSK